MFKFRTKSLFCKIFLAVWLANTAVMLMTTLVVFRQLENSYFIDRHRQYATELGGLVIEAYEAGQALRSFRPLGDKPHLRSAVGAFRRHHFIVEDKHGKVIFKELPRLGGRGGRGEPGGLDEPDWEVEPDGARGRPNGPRNRPGGPRNGPKGPRNGPGGDFRPEFEDLETNKGLSFISPDGDKERKEMRFQLVSAQGESYTVVTDSPDIPRFLSSAIQRLNIVQVVLILLSSAVVSLLLSWLITRPLRTLGHFSRLFSDANYQSRIDEKLLNRGDEIGDLARDFDTMARQVDQNFQQQQQLLYDVSHELRAPLARMQAVAALMELKSPKGEQGQEHRIEIECQRMNTLIQQILDYARLENDARTKTEADIVALISEAVINIQLQYPIRKISCAVSGNGDSKSIYDIKNQLTEVKNLKNIEILWPIHRDLLIRAVENVLGNACKHTPDDVRIELYVLQGDDTLYLDIRDYGPGVDEAEREQLLQPFYRAGNAMQSEGFGLGLSIVTRAIKLHDGKIELNNHDQGGLSVFVSLPK